ncbi:uncharacterized protein N7477_007839 [Penicillium maclennaniae]|uniref:uncharacterized protein n=1 Tax=Penicillium maclennaniae TaxID=1343394 RepID=UPI002540100E|nr:uncharacterized protein N7477_007839 [Penicillium maclennaniae]KAJ5665391.1 hypothetical protein N7477_007839 [Penicillium maclennaniae]
MSSDMHDNRQGQYRAGTISMTVLGAVFVALRFLSRWKKGVSIGWDDYLVLVSLGFLFAVCGLNLSMIEYGMGLHADVLPVKNLVMIAKLLMAFECVYCTAVGIVKISILLMYARIFPTREFRIAAYIIGFIVVSWVIAIICVSVFQCTPIAKAWDTSLPGTCINLKGSFIGNAVPNILTDVAILSLPVHVVWRLQATLVHRLSVIAVFLLGSFVIFTSAYRFSTLFKFEPTDVSWTLAEACTWCLIETSSGIISACMPTLRPLFVMLSSKFGSRYGTSKTRTTDGKTSALRSFGTDGTALRSFTRDGAALRPGDESSSKSHVQMHVSQDDLSDEVPLNTIMVTRDMQWQETTFDGTRRWT